MTLSGALVARSKEGNAEMLAKLSRIGIRGAAVETIRLEEPGDATRVESVVSDIDGFDWVVFTSSRAVAAFAGRLRSRSVDPKGLKPLFAAVGSQTAAALAALGISVSYVPDEFLTSALGRGLPSGHGLKVLLLRADIGDKDLVSILESRGFKVTDVAVYRTRYVEGPVDRSLVSEAAVVVFASPSEVEGLSRRLGGELGGLASRATAVCIGPVTARAAESAGFSKVVFADVHTTDALASKVEEALVHA